MFVVKICRRKALSQRIELGRVADTLPEPTKAQPSRWRVLQDVKLYGIVKIKGFYLPFAFMALTMLMGGKPDELMSDVRGILVGHIWYFFTTLLPKGTGKVYLRTPRWVKYLADKLELTADGAASAPQRATHGFRMPSARLVAAGRPGGAGGAPPPAAGSGGYQAFRGSGNRLGGS
jgi:Derlin-2/3